MKYPGSATVHYVDRSAHCHAGFVVGWHKDGRFDLTYFPGAGTLASARGVIEKQLEASDEPLTEHTWHTECQTDESVGPAPTVASTPTL